MAVLRKIVGNALDCTPSKKELVVIPHICNNEGAWGAGFVVGLAAKWPETREQYLKWHKTKIHRPSHTPFDLGHVLNVDVSPFITVCNMVAQVLGGDRPPIRYGALAQCMKSVQEFCWDMAENGRNVHIRCPMFGSGLAGGHWPVIQSMIYEIWVDREIDVTVVKLDCV